MNSGPRPLPYGRQSISPEDIEAVVAVLRSDFITQGPAIARFEERVAACVGARHAVAVSSATAALHVGALALGLKPGDRLWTSPITFVASANCALYCGAGIDFVDIDPRSYNLSVGALGQKLELAARQGVLPKILVPVHFTGQACEMGPIAELCAAHGVRLMEDASHAIGAEYRGRPIGSLGSDLTVFSFHPVKIITTGEGGMLLTDHAELHARLLRLRSHGTTRDPGLGGQADGPWHYAQVDLGFNYRLTDLQAALGMSQMDRLPEFLARRRALAARYDLLLAPLPLLRPWQHPDTRSSWHLYVIRPDPARTRVSRADLYAGLRALGILAQVHYLPVHLQPWYRAFGFKPGDFPQAERYYDGALSLPLFPAMSDADQDRVVAAVSRLLAD
ncbi:MAG: UDP-4-amino-4,6-dideoxy-N-acetyl-beta-L-altrosamine transaminase [Gammaproteobacteria bacterium]